MRPWPQVQRHSPLPSAFLCRLRCTILVVATSSCLVDASRLRSSWASTATPSLAAPRLVNPFTLTARHVEHPPRHLPHALVTPSTHPNIHRFTMRLRRQYAISTPSSIHSTRVKTILQARVARRGLQLQAEFKPLNTPFYPLMRTLAR
ncbi:hypothetical protein DFH09DRAFT_655450 [Mycena vulgaris]|nr:hypothetical protein DFH09DRAFT_655450 [Mycena vulgaris]